MRSEQTVSPPVLLLGAGVLFWGWQAQLLAVAIPMAALLEAARYVPWRWARPVRGKKDRPLR